MSSIFTAIATWFTKILLKFLYDKAVSEITKAKDEKEQTISDEAIRQAALKKLREQLKPAPVPTEGKDKEGEDAFDDFFNSIDHH